MLFDEAVAAVRYNTNMLLFYKIYSDQSRLQLKDKGE